LNLRYVDLRYHILSYSTNVFTQSCIPGYRFISNNFRRPRLFDFLMRICTILRLWALFVFAMRLERSYDFQTCSTFAETKRPDFLGQAANSTSVVSTVAVISLPSHSFASSCPHFTIYRATVKTFFFVRSKLVGDW
jgi:hypothetical protein